MFNYIQTLTPLMALGIIDNVTDPAIRIYRNINGKSLAWNLKINAITPNISFNGSFRQGIGAGFTGLVGQIVSSVRYNNSLSTSSNPPSNLGGSGGSGGSGGGGGGGGGGGSDEKKHPSINNWSIQEALRHNYEKKIENYQHLVDGWMKKLDKSLEKIGTKVSSVSGNVGDQIDYLKSIKNQNDNLAKSYQISLDALNGGPYYVTISYDKNGESQQEDINIADYMYKDRWGNYQADTTKINKAGSAARKEAIFKAIDSALGPLVSGLLKAKEASQEAQDAIEELQKKVYDTFYGWENEITEVYNLTQKLSNYTGMQERFTSQIALENARLTAGFGDAISAAMTSTAVLNRNTKAIMGQVEATKNMIVARQKELQAAITSTDELEHYTQVWKNAGKTMNDAGVQEAKGKWDAANLALSYVNVQFNLDGTIDYDIDWERFESDRMSATDAINQATYEEVKKQLDNIKDSADNLNSIIKDGTDVLTGLYEQLEEYQKTITDFESTLLKQLEEDLKKQLDNSKKLNTSLKNSLKKLLDEVKRKLTERRQAEDNAKTEEEIAKKQQRLALLRANTSGGNQVEIAQLEKEIADAQQSYQRTLEDQLLQKLQEQGDKAYEQRERQIALLEAQLEFDKSSNKSLVTQWLKNPELYKEEIKRRWLEAQDYDNKGEYEQQQLLQEFEKFYHDYLIAGTRTGYIDNQELRELLGVEETIQDKIETVGGLLNDIYEFLKGLNIEDGISKTVLEPHTAEYFHNQGNSVKEARAASATEGHTLTGAELKAGNYTAKELYDSGIYGYASSYNHNRL